jgi:hypothetical protein
MYRWWVWYNWWKVASELGFAKSFTFFLFFSFGVLEQFQERAREGKKFVLRLVILKDRLCYACVYT